MTSFSNGSRLNLSLYACLALTFLAGAAILGTCLVFGGIAVVYPLSFLGWFSFILIGLYFNAVIQASVNPGLQNLEHPSFWLSAVGNAYLYATDKKRWTLYVSLVAFLSGVVILTPLGFIVVGRALTLNMISSLGAFASWLAGAFFSFSVALALNASVSRDKSQVAMQK